MTPPAKAIEALQITKNYGKIQALKGVSFTVETGSVFSILGPNGAGKTTLLKILTTISNPDTGKAFIEGFNILTQTLEVRQRIGIVSQDNHFDRYLSIWHNLTLHAQMHGLPKKEYEHRITALLKQVDLYDRRFSLADDLSGGMQRRVSLIRALIHNPRVLFLDEPTTGLDPQARAEIWEMIENLKQTATIILTTHYMEEADRLSDRILLLNQGQGVGIGTPRELKLALTPSNKYELALGVPKAKDYATVLQQVINPLTDVPVFEEIIPLNDFTLEFQTAKPENLKEVLRHIDPSDLIRLGKLEANLEDVFLSITKRSNAQERAS